MFALSYLPSRSTARRARVAPSTKSHGQRHPVQPRASAAGESVSASPQSTFSSASKVPTRLDKGALSIRQHALTPRTTDSTTRKEICGSSSTETSTSACPRCSEPSPAPAAVISRRKNSADFCTRSAFLLLFGRNLDDTYPGVQPLQICRAAPGRRGCPPRARDCRTRRERTVLLAAPVRRLDQV